MLFYQSISIFIGAVLSVIKALEYTRPLFLFKSDKNFDRYKISPQTDNYIIQMIYLSARNINVINLQIMKKYLKL